MSEHFGFVWSQHRKTWRFATGIPIASALRRAVVARDRHCVASGCRRSAGWCDVHHIVSWADGGETEINNLCLLCRYHHSRLHLELLKLDDLEIRPLESAARARSI